MPDIIRRTGSMFLLGTYVTTIAIAATLFVGKEVLVIYSDRIEQREISETVKSLDNTLKAFSKEMHLITVDIHEHHLLLERCKERMDNCEQHLDKFHEGVKHD